MRACRQCGLSIGAAATFCPVCSAVAEPEEAPPTTGPSRASAERERAVGNRAENVRPRTSQTSSGVSVAADHEAQARRCEGTDTRRSVALYRQAIVELLESSEDPLGSESVRRDLQRIFARLSLVLQRSGQMDDAAEEIESAAYLGLVVAADPLTAMSDAPSVATTRA
jgi:hypothetical protein